MRDCSADGKMNSTPQNPENSVSEFRKHNRARFRQCQCHMNHTQRNPMNSANITG